jgi:amidohydrolase
MTLLDDARGIQDSLVTWRREFHMHPEVGFDLPRTAGRVAEICEGLGCRVRTGVGKSGVLAELGQGEPVLAIRADMDALPLDEANDVSYRSQNPGRMHACGHDAHTAMALGVAFLLARETFPGSLRLVFQPAEEVCDQEGLSGAQRMAQDGAMQGVAMVLAQHVDPATPVGSIRVESGPASGGVDSWFGRVIGKGAHGARPQAAIDPIYLAAHVILGLNAIVSRRLDPFDPAVVSIGSLHGGQAENVIPEVVELSGTLRYTERRVQERIHVEIRRAFELTRPLGGDYELRFELGLPPMINDPQAVALIGRAAGDLIGPGNVLPFEKDLGGEDFGAFLDLVPGAMFGLGTLVAGDERIGHSPRFDVDESALPIGTAILAESALRFLRGQV